jgi:hypothetical protein
VLVLPLLLLLAALTPTQRTLRARMGAHALHAQGKTNTDAARKASPQSLDYWAAKVDPDSALPEQERCRRAEHARKAYMTGLALASSQARRRRSGDDAA